MFQPLNVRLGKRARALETPVPGSVPSARVALIRPPILQIPVSFSSYGAIPPIGLAYVAAGTGLLVGATPARAWRLCFVSILYLPALLTLMVLDKVIATS
jgi:hypothetical protein